MSTPMDVHTALHWYARDTTVHACNKYTEPNLTVAYTIIVITEQIVDTENTIYCYK